jgi:hypothetical protein
VPDRLSTPAGETVRKRYAEHFAALISGHLHDDGLWLTLPFQAALLTDPILFIVGGGLVVLDHPTVQGHAEFALKGQVIDTLPQRSLYETRYPRLIGCSRKGEDVQLGTLSHRITDFRGPFHEQKAL